MAWVELFAVFLVCHLAGDFILQTNWQATHKHGGLGADPLARHALLSHVATYTLAYLPALVWIGVELNIGWAVAAAAMVAVPHMIQDDARLLRIWARRVKKLDERGGTVMLALDQSFHVVALLAAALIVA
jgi:Protein of unknown function (DUF3307)